MKEESGLAEMSKPKQQAGQFMKEAVSLYK